MRISALILIVLTFSMFSAGLIGYYSSLLNANGLTPKDFNGLNNTSSTISNLYIMYNIVNASQSNSGSSDGTMIGFAPWNLIVGAYNAGMMGIQLPVFFYNMARTMTSSVTGMPAYVFDILSAIILVIVIGAIIYFITGKFW